MFRSGLHCEPADSGPTRIDAGSRLEAILRLLSFVDPAVAKQRTTYAKLGRSVVGAQSPGRA